MLDDVLHQVVWLGKHDTQEAAAAAHDLGVVRRLGPATAATPGRLNFPLQTYISELEGRGGRRGRSGRSGGGRGAGRGRNRGSGVRGGGKPVSQYKGVSWSSSCSRWVAVIWDRVERKARHLGVFNSEEEAARAFDKEPEAFALPDCSCFRSGETRAWSMGRQHFIGTFTSEEEAARAYDRAILKLGGSVAKSTSRLNFPITDYDLDQIAAMSLTQAESSGLAWSMSGSQRKTDPAHYTPGK
eukprot:gene2944-3229_t